MAERTTMREQCEKFNRECPVGTAVIVTIDDQKQVRDVVIAPSLVVAGHTPIAWLRDVGPYPLSRICKDTDADIAPGHRIRYAD